MWVVSQSPGLRQPVHTMLWALSRQCLAGQVWCPAPQLPPLPCLGLLALGPPFLLQFLYTVVLLLVLILPGNLQVIDPHSTSSWRLITGSVRGLALLQAASVRAAPDTTYLMLLPWSADEAIHKPGDGREKALIVPEMLPTAGSYSPRGAVGLRAFASDSDSSLPGHCPCSHYSPAAVSLRGCNH